MPGTFLTRDILYLAGVLVVLSRDMNTLSWACQVGTFLTRDILYRAGVLVVPSRDMNTLSWACQVPF